jgi:protein ImuB
LSTDRGDDEDADLVTAGLALLRLVPDEVIPATGRQLGFWGGDPAATDRAGRALARVQGMLGHPAVVTPVPQGGRTPGERVRWVPWGDPREPERPCEPPWPGTLPDPAPARVLDPPAPAELLDADGRPVVVSGRGEPTAVPARLQCPLLGRTLEGGGGPIVSWTGPWPHDARWWDGPARRRGVYWRVTVADVTCLVVVTAGHAAVEAIYD